MKQEVLGRTITLLSFDAIRAAENMIRLIPLLLRVFVATVTFCFYHGHKD
jgi:hypothetical protein